MSESQITIQKSFVYDKKKRFDLETLLSGSHLDEEAEDFIRRNLTEVDAAHETDGYDQDYRDIRVKFSDGTQITALAYFDGDGGVSYWDIYYRDARGGDIPATDEIEANGERLVLEEIEPFIVAICDEMD